MAKVVNICDVCKEIFAGGDAPKNNMSLEKTTKFTIPIYSNGEANDGLYGFTDFARVTEPSITISARGTIGYTSIRTKPFVPIVRLITIVPRQDVINIKYLYYATQNYNFGGSGTSIQQLTVPTLKKYNFPLPNLEEQEQIVSTLDKICDLISDRKHQLLQLDKLVKSRFIELFGDYDLSHIQSEWKTISEIGKVVGGATPKTNIEEYWDGEYRWITPAELDTDSGYIYDSVRKLTKAGIESCSLQEIPINTVILSSRAPIGKVAITGNTFYCNQGFKNIICDKDVLPRYLYTVLLLNTDYLNSLGRGATFKEISKSIVENIKIPVPPIDLQNQFATFVEQTDKLKFEVKQSLEQLETLKKSLMQQYFG